MKTLFDIVDKETDYGLTECLEVNIEIGRAHV